MFLKSLGKFLSWTLYLDSEWRDQGLLLKKNFTSLSRHVQNRATRYRSFSFSLKQPLFLFLLFFVFSQIKIKNEQILLKKCSFYVAKAELDLESSIYFFFLTNVNINSLLVHWTAKNALYGNVVLSLVRFTFKTWNEKRFVLIKIGCPRLLNLENF